MIVSNQFFFRKDTIFEIPYTLEKELEPFAVFFYQSFSFSAFWAEVFDSSWPIDCSGSNGIRWQSRSNEREDVVPMGADPAS